MTIVGCMGGMYAIIPAVFYSEEIGEEIGRTYGLSSAQVRCDEVGLLPLRFFVLRLQGIGGRAFGQLLIHDASRFGDGAPADDAINEILDPFVLQDIDRSQKWSYQCSARGCEIWISLADLFCSAIQRGHRSIDNREPCRESFQTIRFSFWTEFGV